MQVTEDSFLGRLIKIYRSLAVLVDSRLHLHRKTDQPSHHSLTKAMLTRIKTISRLSATKNSEAKPKPETVTTAHQNLSQQLNHEHYSDVTINNSELSRHLKQADRLTSHLHLAEDLRSRTWEHVHAAFRFAHIGNEYNARLHARIVSDCLDELRHYIEQDEYQKLIEEIDQYFTTDSSR